MAPIEVFARRLRQLRRALTLTQKELATRAGVSRTYLARIELGKQEPTLGMIERLAKALRVTPAELMQPGTTSREAGRKRKP